MTEITTRVQVERELREAAEAEAKRLRQAAAADGSTYGARTTLAEAERWESLARNIGKRPASTYALSVKFKSNEAPWSGAYQPATQHQPIDDVAAIEWAVGMSDGLGMDYLVTLIKDGEVIPLPVRALDARR